jgi:uncharacterized protein (DUF488 family)
MDSGNLAVVDGAGNGAAPGMARHMWTIGHSNRSLADFVALLQEAGVTRLVDVRTRPASRRFPWFHRGRLQTALKDAGIAYHWEGEALGGKRSATPDDAERHPALDEPGLRAFASHMETVAFRGAVDRLLTTPGEETAVMCAEADPARCHRALIADYLEAVRQRAVSHIMGPGRQQRHAVHHGARAVGGLLRYDRSQTERLL